MHRGVILVALVSVLLVLASVPGAGLTDTEEASATIAADTLEAGPGQAVYGETDLQVGAEVTVRVTLLDGPSFEHERTAVVTHTGEYHTVLDLSGVAANTTVELAVEHDQRVLTSETRTVRPCQHACNATDGASPDDEIVLDGGDDVALEAGPGRVVRGGTSLPPGTELTVSLEQGSSLSYTTANVTADGTFRAVFYLSHLETNRDGTIRVQWTGEELVRAEQPLTVTECTTACELDRTDVDDDPRTQFVGDFDQTFAYGETVLVPVDLHETDSAAVQVGGPGTLEATARVQDGTGDGRVTIAFNTRPDGGEPILFAVDAGDTVDVDELSGALAPPYLTLELHPDQADGERTDSVRLRLTEPTDSGVEGGTDDSTGGTGNGTPSGLPLSSLGLLALAGIAATAGVALLTGVLDLK